jgi:hypothetical protein
MKSLFAVLLIGFLTRSVSAQGLKGIIKDSDGEAIPYATVYIQELRQGTTSNTKGNYEIHLPAGKYTVVYQSLGYAPDLRTVSLGKDILNLDIILQVQYYEIPEVRITASGEDPAYGIMRKVIGMAPYYLNQVSHYKADVYLKGNLTINKIPKFIQKSMKAETSDHEGTSSGSATMKAGDTYLMESVNELEFSAPDRYVQRVISYNSTFPEQGNEISPMDFIKASFYQPVLAEIAISPLSPEALFHYTFKYKGASAQGNYIIDKIQVIPKRKSQQLFSGIIYIIEDLWCLHSIDLLNENIAGKVKIEQLFIPVQEDIWMPVSDKFEININIIGFKANAGYGSSIKYNEVFRNNKLQKPLAIATDYSGRASVQKTQVDTAKSKTKMQIEKILSKEELTNRDMAKLSSLMQKDSRNSQDDSIRKSLEVRNSTTYIIEKDAGKKDSAYWAAIRPIPLSESEMKSLRTVDSLKARLKKQGTNIDSTSVKTKKKKRFFTTIKNIVFTHTWSDTLGLSFTHGGIIGLKNLSFNTVDGFVYGTNFRLNKTWDKTRSLTFAPDFRWAFSRESFMWRINIQYRFDRMKQRQVYIRSGMTSKDINNAGGVNTLINSITTLFMSKNYLKLYESKYITAGFRSEITNGLYLELTTGYEDRRVLANTTNYSFIESSRLYTENIPVNPYLKDPPNPYNELRDQKHGDFAATFSYTPRQRYSMQGSIKIPRGSDYPTFSLTWKHGINDFTELTPQLRQYDLVKFEISKRETIGAFSEYRWRFRTGGFLDNRYLPFYDFTHFSSQPLPLLLSDYEDAFMLPGFYALSTPEYFTEFHIKYTTPYLLLKLLPVLSNTLMRENLSLSYLWSRYQKAYTEIGYSLSEFLFVGEIGVYAGFDNLTFNSIGAKVVLKFN